MPSPSDLHLFFLGTAKQHATENNVATEELVAAQPFEDIDPQSQHNLLESFWCYNTKTSQVFDAIGPTSVDQFTSLILQCNQNLLCQI